jgi:hypothetical protein
MCPCWVWTWIVFVATLILFGVLVWKRRTLTKETFEATQQPPPDLNKMLTHVQSMLDKIATPEVMAHMTTVMNKDPGELARLYADQQKKQK